MDTTAGSISDSAGCHVQVCGVDDWSCGVYDIDDWSYGVTMVSMLMIGVMMSL